MGELLFLAHRMPYPPIKGDKIRSWHFLRHLASNHRVHLGCFFDDPDDLRNTPVLRGICGECRFEPAPQSRFNRHTLVALLDGTPLSVGAFRSAAMTAWAADLARRRPIDRVFVFSSAMAQHAPAGPAMVVDFVDVDSDKWRQYAAAARPPASWIYGREARGLLEFDRAAARAARASLFVSPAEATLFRDLAPDAADRVHVVPNGVDLDYFSPDGRHPAPEGFGGSDIVFTGAMDYRPNVDAVTWFGREVLPEVRRRRPEARFWIVGAKPTREVRQLGSMPWVRITGTVDDVRPWLAHAGVVVAPLRLARGTQNKVLEAMAMGRPVVSTPAACRGIAVGIGDEILVADAPAAYADAVAGLLSAPTRAAALGRRARARVERDYDWRTACGKLDSLMFASANKIAAPV